MHGAPRVRGHDERVLDRELGDPHDVSSFPWLTKRLYVDRLRSRYRHIGGERRQRGRPDRLLGQLRLALARGVDDDHGHVPDE